MKGFFMFRSVRYGAFFLLFAAVSGLSAAPEASRKARPNLIFLLTDDQCTYSVGCYGNKDVKTPQMDRIGLEGVIFERHYDTTAICMASRANIMTGLYEYRTGCNFGRGNLPEELWKSSYPMLLRKAGYLTAFAGKFGITVEGRGLCEKDFDWWGGGPGQTNYSTAKNASMKKYADRYPHATLSYGAFGQDVVREAVQKKKPFCLSISFKAPHRPVTPDPKFDGVYEGKTFRKPDNFGRENGTHFSEQSRQDRQYARFKEWNYDSDYDGVMAKYHQLIYAVDVAIGMIREEVKRQGVADNTVIIFTSDNGYICGSHGYGSKVIPMEESSRVPLMIYDPRAGAAGKGKRCRALTGNIDIAPTLLDLAGVAVPEGLDGRSLVPLLSDPAGDVREQMALMNVWGKAPMSCLTAVTKRWKYTWWGYAEGMAPAEELFDLENDPLEMRNLAGETEYAKALEEMRARYNRELEAWKAKAREHYKPFGVLFDRALDWEERKSKGSVGKAGKKKKKKAK